MKASIRPATVSDAEAICTVIHRTITERCSPDHNDDPRLIEAWLRNKTPANVAAWIEQQGHFCAVAMVADTLVGFGMSKDDQILLCYVLPECQGQGVGHALLRAIESHAAAQGIAQLRLESTRTALAFYRRADFRPTGAAIAAFGMGGQPMSKRILTRVAWSPK